MARLYPQKQGKKACYLLCCNNVKYATSVSSISEDPAASITKSSTLQVFQPKSTHLHFDTWRHVSLAVILSHSSWVSERSDPLTTFLILWHAQNLWMRETPQYHHKVHFSLSCRPPLSAAVFIFTVITVLSLPSSSDYQWLQRLPQRCTNL